MARSTPRPRRDVGSTTLLLLRILFRYSVSREADVLRLVGNRIGPVLRERAPGPGTHPTAGSHSR